MNKGEIISKEIEKAVKRCDESINAFCPLCKNFVQIGLNYNPHHNDKTIYWNYREMTKKGYVCEDVNEDGYDGGCGKFLEDSQIIEYNSPQLWQDKSLAELLFSRLQNYADMIRGDWSDFDGRSNRGYLESWMDDMRTAIKLEYGNN